MLLLLLRRLVRAASLWGVVLGLLVFTSGVAGATPAINVSLDGAQLSASPDVSFPTRQPTLSGTSLEYGAGSGYGDVLLRWDLLDAGALSAGDPDYTIRITANVTRQGDTIVLGSLDWEQFIFLWDGTATAGGYFYDGVSTDGLGGWTGTSNGSNITHDTHHGDVPVSLFPSGSSGNLELTAVLGPDSTTITTSYLGTSASYSTTAINRTSEISLLLALQHSWEMSDINQISVSAVPEPSTALLLGIGLAGLGMRRRRRTRRGC